MGSDVQIVELVE